VRARFLCITSWRCHSLRQAAFFLTAVLAAPAVSTVGSAQTSPVEQTTADHYATYIAEAAHRFGMPETWIRAVIEVESAGYPRAISSAGAMGLMQLMPGTWAEMREDLKLGEDPYDPRENILAGTAYLRAMYDRFGAPGFLAAYNAGPARYAEHLAAGRPLPRETRDYVARLAPLLDAGNTAPLQQTRTKTASDWRDAPLFIPDGMPAQDTANDVESGVSTSDAGSLFVPIRTGDGP
jgi:hypothetical protein